MNLKSKPGRLPSKSPHVSKRPGSCVRFVLLSCVIIVISFVQILFSHSIHEDESVEADFFLKCDTSRVPFQCRMEAKDSQEPVAKPEVMNTNDTRILGFPIHKNNVFHLKQVRSEAAVAAGREYTARARERAALPEGYGRFGINVPQPPNASVIKRIWIWGERSSCTTAITEVLMKNFVLNCDISDQRHYFMGVPSCVLGGYPWKHGSMQDADLRNSEESLHILVSRHAYEWVASLRRSAPHASIHQGRTMPDFLTLEWVSLTVSGMLEHKLNDHIAGITPIVLGSRRLLQADSQGPSSGPGRQPNVRTPNNVGASENSDDYMRPSGSPALAKPAPARAAAVRRAAAAAVGAATVTDAAAAVKWGESAAADRVSNVDARRLGMRRRGSRFRVVARSGQPQEDGGRRSAATKVVAAAKAAAGRRLLEEDPDFEYISEMMSDREWGTEDRYPTVMAMREAKLRDWLLVAARLPFAEHVACRDFMLDPREVLEGLERKFGLTRKNQEWDLGGCVWRQGQCISKEDNFRTAETLKEKREHYLNMRFMSDFDEHTLAIANAWLDPELEGLFGYRLFDSLQDAAQPYTRQNRCSVHGSCPRQ